MVATILWRLYRRRSFSWEWVLTEFKEDVHDELCEAGFRNHGHCFVNDGQLFGGEFAGGLVRNGTIGQVNEQRHRPVVGDLFYQGYVAGYALYRSPGTFGKGYEYTVIEPVGGYFAFPGLAIGGYGNGLRHRISYFMAFEYTDQIAPALPLQMKGSPRFRICQVSGIASAVRTQFNYRIFKIPY